MFWWALQRPDLIDVSIGLFDEAQNGARAEDWLEWHRGRVGFLEKASKPFAFGGLNGLNS